jgi:DNA-binding NtrC family response regulator
MAEKFTILIAERNRNVRTFLRREFVADGYMVKLAKNDRELFNIVDGDAAADLLILDLDMPFAGGLAVLEELQRRKPLLPVVIHTFPTEYATHVAVQAAAAFLEKTGSNIDHLKTVIRSVLERFYPERCE